MKLTNLLMKLGLVYGGDPQATPEPPPAAPKSAFQKVVLRLEDMRAEDRSAAAQAEEAGLGLRKTFAEIYSESGIGEPPHGVSLESLDRLIQGLPEEKARQAVLGALQEKGVPVRDILLDGHHRDQALDAFEQALDEHVAEWEKAVEDRAERLLREARELEQQARDLRARVPGVKRELAEWKDRKHQEEDLMELLGRMLAEAKPEAEGRQPSPERAEAKPAEGS